jgi:hypothetical protein
MVGGTSTANRIILPQRNLDMTSNTQTPRTDAPSPAPKPKLPLIGALLGVAVLVLLATGVGIWAMAARTQLAQVPQQPAAAVETPIPPVTPQPVVPATPPVLPTPPKPPTPAPPPVPHDADIFVYQATTPARTALKRTYTQAKSEPLAGCYVGAYLESALDVPNHPDARGATREAKYGAILKKPMASTFTYVNYGSPFPTAWAKALWAQGIAPHVAWEPNGGLDAVKDDEYLRQFARDAAAVDAPIFLRFASEMNGEWVAYSGDPAKYREKFALVHDVMECEAPKVIMFWCVFTEPTGNIASYYPGDQYVDWVGVNVYNVYYHNNSKKSPAYHEQPATLLRNVYDTYSARKPIAIGEYGATHYDTVDRAERREFQAIKLAQLLNALPRKFPRVKMLNFFECNNVKYAPVGRRLNNYAITDNPLAVRVVREALSSSYYLSRMTDETQDDLPSAYSEVADGAAFRGKTYLSAWLSSTKPVHTLTYAIDGKVVAKTPAPGAHRTTFDAGALGGGIHTLTVTARNAGGDVMAERTMRFTATR